MSCFPESDCFLKQFQTALQLFCDAWSMLPLTLHAVLLLWCPQLGELAPGAAAVGAKELLDAQMSRC
jgi:hypothetical protein